MPYRILGRKAQKGDTRYEQNLSNAMQHIRFCIKIYRHQDDNKIYYLHEHPATATSWRMPEMEELRASPNAIETVSHLCAFGLETTVDGIKLLAKKPTRFLTDSPLISRELTRKCDKNHEHGHLVSGRAGPAARYTNELCRAIVKGTIAQKEADRKGLAAVGEVCSISVVTPHQQREIEYQSRRTHEEE